MDCDISFLPGLLLDCAGLNGDRFFQANSEMRRRLNGNIQSNADAMAREAYLRVCYEIAAFPDRYASDAAAIAGDDRRRGIEEQLVRIGGRAVGQSHDRQIGPLARGDRADFHFASQRTARR